MQATPARKQAAAVLARVVRGKHFAVDLLGERIASGALVGRERAFAHELVLGSVRRFKTLEALIEAAGGVPSKRQHPNARVPLLLGAYQLVMLDSVPPHAAVNQSVALVRSKKVRSFVNAVLRQLVRKLGPMVEELGRDTRYFVPVRAGVYRRCKSPLLPDWSGADSAALAVAHSYPQPLVEAWLAQFGRDEAARLLEVGNEQAPLFLRVNTQRLSRDQLVEALAAVDIHATAVATMPHAVQLPAGTRPHELAVLRDGDCVIQDVCAQLVAPALGAAAGDLVLDLCAAPGGKAVHIAETMANVGRVVAVDLSLTRSGSVKEVVRRTGASSVTACVADGRRLPFASGRFDRVLVDAPCSNTGVLRRRPEARWRYEARALEQLTAVQRKLLTAALQVVRPGGLVVYSTCSIDASENAVVVSAVCRGRKDVSLVREHLSLPEHGGRDGGYYAVIHRIS